MATDKAIAAAEEQDWRARDDARTLAEAITIQNDKGRNRRAISKAKIIAKEEEKRLSGIRTVAKKKVAKAIKKIVKKQTKKK